MNPQPLVYKTRALPLSYIGVTFYYSMCYIHIKSLCQRAIIKKAGNNLPTSLRLPYIKKAPFARKLRTRGQKARKWLCLVFGYSAEQNTIFWITIYRLLRFQGASKMPFCWFGEFIVNYNMPHNLQHWAIQDLNLWPHGCDAMPAWHFTNFRKMP